MEGWAGGQSKGTMYSEWDGDTPTATPLGKPTAKLRVILRGERCAIVSYAARLETEPWWGQQLAGVTWLGPSRMEKLLRASP